MTEPAPAPTRYATFAEFWPFYLREHTRPRTRALHYVGTSLVVAVAAFALVTGRYGMLLAMPVAGYFFAWLAHFWIEKNRPATFTYPLWSLAADFRMWCGWRIGGRFISDSSQAELTNVAGERPVLVANDKDDVG